MGGQRRCPSIDARLGASFLEPLVLLVFIARFVANAIATSSGSFLIAVASAAACLSAPTPSSAAATAVTCAWGGAVPGDVARLVTIVAVAERAISLALRLAPLPGLYDA